MSTQFALRILDFVEQKYGYDLGIHWLCNLRPENPTTYTTDEVHSPTNALFIKLDKVLKFTLKITVTFAPTVSVYDRHQGAFTRA